MGKSPFFVRDEIHRYRVDTVPCVLLCEVLAYKDVAKVSAAVSTLDFGSHAVGVRQPPNRARDFLVKAWPATVRLKLAFRTVQPSSAAFADVGAFFPERVILPSERHFGAFVHDNLFFFRSKLFEVCLIFRS